MKPGGGLYDSAHSRGFPGRRFRFLCGPAYRRGLEPGL